jgi:hypothetical protein
MINTGLSSEVVGVYFLLSSVGYLTALSVSKQLKVEPIGER